ncbi:hypothetical protein Tco_1368504 [Tanacetum coccineum]
MLHTRGVDFHTLAIDKGIHEGLEVGVEHGKAGRELGELGSYDSRVETRYEAAVKELENLVAKQVTVLIYYERGGSRVPSSMSHKILLHDALDASRARAKKGIISPEAPTALESVTIEPVLITVLLIAD